MHVTGTPGNGNPSPASFAGSGEGTTVTLNLGDYNVSEDFEDSASSPLKVVRSFSTDCSGLIETAGEGRECNVTNEFAVKEYLFLSKWGSAGTGDGQFNVPFGVAVNPETGSVYVADTFNNRVQVFDSTGTFITILGSFNTPVDVALKPTTGNIYVTDTGNDRIQVFFLDP
jgi:DNA-binding beta-propeller fold protein YncE